MRLESEYGKWNLPVTFHDCTLPLSGFHVGLMESPKSVSPRRDESSSRPPVQAIGFCLLKRKEVLNLKFTYHHHRHDRDRDQNRKKSLEFPISTLKQFGFPGKYREKAKARRDRSVAI
jgi:hypothetical protein